MATYKEIFGKKIQFLATDPTDTGAEGQVWYNSTSATFKSVLRSEATLSGQPMINARGQNGSAHFGTQTAALSVAGNPQPSPPYVSTNAEEYNGSGWSVGGVYPTAVFGAYGCGTQTAALIYGGRTNPPGTNVTDVTASYNGTSWSPEGALSTARQSIGAFGATEITAIAAGGHNAPGDYLETEEYSGTAWTTVPAPYIPQSNMGAAGTSTAGITIAGNPTTGSQLFDGSAWTTGPVQNTARGSLNQGLAGHTQDAVVALGATPPANTGIESYDGSSWSTSPATLATGRSQAASSGTNTSAVLYGGTTTAYVSTVEEYNVSTNVIAPEAWESGGALNTARRQFTGTGNTQATSLAIAGTYPPTNTLNATETYDGSAWATSPATLTTARKDLMSVGSQSAALAIGGNDTGDAAAVESFNGSAWTASPALASAKQNGQAGGTQAAAICFRGEPHPSPGKETQIWDDISWTTSPLEMNTNRGALGRAGQVDTAVLAFGVSGGDVPPTGTTATESWNGSGWTTETAMPTALRSLGGAGLGDAALAFGGGSPPSAPVTTLTSGFDGTAWSTRPAMATARDNIEGSGTQTAALAFGGVSGPGTTLDATEEFGGGVGGLNYKTITTS